MAASAKAEDKREIKALVSGLYDLDMKKRLKCAKALGEVSRLRPDYISKMWPRIFYAFDDTMSCWGAAEGIGEIGRNLPALRSKIIHLLKKFQRDEASCQGYVWAVCRIGQVDPEMVEDFIPELKNLLASTDICMLGQAIWALGELRVQDAAETIRDLVSDRRETWIYENHDASMKSIGTIAAEAIEKIESAAS